MEMPRLPCAGVGEWTGGSFSQWYCATRGVKTYMMSGRDVKVQLKFSVDAILGKKEPESLEQPKEMVQQEPPCMQCMAALYRCCQNEPPLLTLPLPLPYTHLHPALRPTTNGTVPYSAPAGESPMYRLALPSSSQKTENPKPTDRRKRTWTRAVFSNLQRKGLERRFETEKYIAKPDRKQLAARLGLTDDQVKVWFQNRRMKWRHQEGLRHTELHQGERGDRHTHAMDDTSRRRRSQLHTEEDDEINVDSLSISD